MIDLKSVATKTVVGHWIATVFGSRELKDPIDPTSQFSDIKDLTSEYNDVSEYEYNFSSKRIL